MIEILIKISARLIKYYKSFRHSNWLGLGFNGEGENWRIGIFVLTRFEGSNTVFHVLYFNGLCSLENKRAHLVFILYGRIVVKRFADSSLKKDIYNMCSFSQHMQFSWLAPELLRGDQQSPNQLQMDVAGEQVRFELAGSMPFKSNFISVLDFKTVCVCPLLPQWRGVGRKII